MGDVEEMTAEDVIDKMAHDIARVYCHLEDVGEDLSAISETLDDFMKTRTPDVDALLAPFAEALQTNLAGFEEIARAVRDTLDALNHRLERLELGGRTRPMPERRGDGYTPKKEAGA